MFTCKCGGVIWGEAIAQWFPSSPKNHVFPASPTYTPTIRKIMAFMAAIMGLGLLFYILLGVNPKSIGVP